MRRSIRLITVTALTVLAATACGGGGGKSDATTNTDAGKPAAAGTAAGAPADAGKAAGGASPAETGADGGMAADGDDDKIAQGTDLEKAKDAGLGSDGAPVVNVVGTDTSCKPDAKSIKAGKVWFKFTNQGSKISEVYLETADGDKLAEVERIKAGQSGAFSYTVKKGKFQVSCVPGMNDHQLQVPLKVS